MGTTTKAGDHLSNRDGSLVQGPAMSFTPPYWIYEEGVATVNYGDDQDAALDHYDRLVRERRLATNNTAAVFVN